VRARPGRRTVEERQQAVLELMAGKATVDQIARRLGVHAATVEGWRQDALGGMVEALRRGNGKTPRELELERKADQLEQVVTKLSIQKCLLEQALDIERAGRPTAPARSKR
jgi:transposase-like protein